MIPFKKLHIKTQHRRPQVVKPINVCGLDTETHVDIGRVELLASESGEYVLPYSLDDLLDFFFQKRFKGASFVFFNMQYDVQAILKWMDFDHDLQETPIRFNSWIAQEGGFSPRDAHFHYIESMLFSYRKNVKRVKRGYTYGLIQEQSDNTIESLLVRSKVEGFLPERASGIDLLDAMEADATGTPQYQGQIWLSESVIESYKNKPPNPWQELWDYGETTFQGHVYSLIPWKLFSIRSLSRKQRVQFFDVFQFFNTALDVAAQKYIGQKKLDIVDRTAITNFAHPDTIRYCVHDAKLAGDLARYVLSLSDLHFPDSPKSLISKASISEKHFRQTCDIPTINHTIDNNPRFIEMAYRTYKGGLFSAYQRGYFDKLYLYDINSAYPAEMAKLPDLTKGRFVEVKGAPPEGAYMGWLACRVDIDGSLDNSYISPLACDFKGRRLYPSGSFTTWLTLPEYEAIQPHHWIQGLIGVYWFPNEAPQFPLADEVKKLYHWKNTETDPGLRYFIKIVLNSLYGKTIQKIPDRDSGLYLTGNLFNPFWASYITAGTRLELYRQMQKMDYADLVLVATDSILSRKPLDMPLNNELGQWALDKTGEGVIIGSGVYSIRDDSDYIETRNRGFNTTNNVNFFWPGSGVINEKTGYPTSLHIDVKNHFTLARALIQGDYQKMNLITDTYKTLDLNFDTNRLWSADFKTVDDILTRQISSVPLDINCITERG